MATTTKIVDLKTIAAFFGVIGAILGLSVFQYLAITSGAQFRLLDGSPVLPNTSISCLGTPTDPCVFNFSMTLNETVKITNVDKLKVTFSGIPSNIKSYNIYTNMTGKWSKWTLTTNKTFTRNKPYYFSIVATKVNPAKPVKFSIGIENKEVDPVFDSYNQDQIFKLVSFDNDLFEGRWAVNVTNPTAKDYNISFKTKNADAYIGQYFQTIHNNITYWDVYALGTENISYTETVPVYSYIDHGSNITYFGNGTNISEPWIDTIVTYTNVTKYKIVNTKLPYIFIPAGQTKTVYGTTRWSKPYFANSSPIDFIPSIRFSESGSLLLEVNNTKNAWYNSSWYKKKNVTVFAYENWTNIGLVFNVSFGNGQVYNITKEVRLVKSTEDGLLGFRFLSAGFNTSSSSYTNLTFMVELNTTNQTNQTFWVYYNSTSTTEATEKTSWNVTTLPQLGSWSSGSNYAGSFPSIDMGNFDGDSDIEIGGLRGERDYIRATSIKWSSGTLATDSNIEIKTGSYEYTQTYPAIVVDIDADNLKEYAGGTNSYGGSRYEPRYYVINGSFNNKDLTYLESGTTGAAMPIPCDYGLDGTQNICGLSAMNTNSKLHFFYGQNLSDIITAITIPSLSSGQEGAICLLDTEGSGVEDVVGVVLRNSTGSSALWAGQYWLKNGTAIRNGSFSKGWTPNSAILPIGCDGVDHDLDGKEDMLIGFSAYSGSYWNETDIMLFNKSFVNISWPYQYLCGAYTCHAAYPRKLQISKYGQLIAFQQYYSNANDYIKIYNTRLEPIWKADQSIKGIGFIAGGYDVNGDTFNDFAAGGGQSATDYIHLWSTPKYNFTEGSEQDPPQNDPYLVEFGAKPATTNTSSSPTVYIDARALSAEALSYLAIFTNETSWSAKVVNSSPYNNTWWNTSLTFSSSGTYKIGVYANTSGGGNFSAENRTYTYDTAPKPEFGTSLADGVWINGTAGSARLDLRASDDFGLSWIGFYDNSTGSWGLNYYNTSPYNNSWDSVTNLVQLPAGCVKWAVWANDTRSNVNFTNTNRTYCVDTTGPTVTQGNPQDNYYSPSSSITYYYTCSDYESGPDCVRVFRNTSGSWSSGFKDCALTNGVEEDWTQTSISDGTYKWGLFCNNTVSGESWTTNRTFTIDTLTPSSLSYVSPTPVNYYYAKNPSYLEVNVSYTDATPWRCYLWYDNEYDGTWALFSNYSAGDSYCFYNDTGPYTDKFIHYKVQVLDRTGHQANSTDQDWQVDNTAPNVWLKYPTNGLTTNNVTIYFFFNSSINYGCGSIWGNWTGSWARNATNCTGSSKTGADSHTNYTLQISDISNGYYKWSVSANDSLNNENTSFLVNYTLEIVRYPNVGYFEQYPSDWTILGLFTNSPFNTSFKINDTSGINDAKVNLTWHVNSTSLGTDWGFINGSVIRSGNQTLTTHINSSGIYNFSLTENDIAPTEASTNATRFGDAYSLSSISSAISVTIYNGTGNLVYELLELGIANTSATAGDLEIRVCNSTWGGTTFLTNNNCGIICNQPRSLAVNHTHGAANNHSLCIVPTNFSTGMWGSVKVSQQMTYIIRAKFPAGWVVWTNQSVNSYRTNQVRTTANNGLSWTNQNWAVNLHRHFGNQTEYVNRWACAANAADLSTCTLATPEILSTGSLPPTQPIVFSPSEGYYNNITINWNPSASPNGYYIKYYNITLAYPNETVIENIYNASNTTFSFFWDTTTISEGTYEVQVTATDANELSATAHSEEFIIDHTSPFIQQIFPSDAQWIDSSNVNLTLFGTDNYGFANQSVWFPSGEVCYQETPNVTTSCGGLDTGNFSPQYCSDTFGGLDTFIDVFDGDWDTTGWFSCYGIGTVVSNSSVLYTVPPGVDAATLLVRFGEYASPQTLNLTIPSACISSDINISLSLTDNIVLGSSVARVGCLQGTSYIPIYQINSLNNPSFYEEAVYWTFPSDKTTNFTPFNNSNTIFDFSDLSEGTYTWLGDACDLAGNCNNTNEQSFFVDYSEPLIFPGFYLLSYGTQVSATKNSPDILVSALVDSFPACTEFWNNFSGSWALHNSTCDLWTDGYHNLTNQSFAFPSAGYWKLSVAGNDTFGHTNRSFLENYTVCYDAGMINYTISYPNNRKENNSFYLNISVSNYCGATSASLYSNFTGSWALNQTNNTPSENDFSFLINSLSEGTYTYDFVVTGESTIANNSFVFNYTLDMDSVAPSVNLLDPADNNISSINPVTFIINSTSNGPAALNCASLYGNWSGWGIKNSSCTNVDGNFTILAGGITSGIYVWSASVNDTFNNTNSSFGVNRTLYFDTGDPTATIYPSGLTYSNTSPYVFKIYAADDLSLKNVTFFSNISGYTSVTNSSPYNDTNTSFSIVVPTDGYYWYFGQACDILDQCTTTSNNTFGKDTIEPIFTGIEFMDGSGRNCVNQHLTDIVYTYGSDNAGGSGISRYDIYSNWSWNGLDSTWKIIGTSTGTYYGDSQGTYGIYRMSAAPYDNAGNGNLSFVHNITVYFDGPVGSSEPVTSWIYPASNNSVVPTSQLLNVSGADLALWSCTYYVNDTIRPGVLYNTSTGGYCTADISDLTSGYYRVYATLEDRCAWTNNTPVYYFTVDTIPFVNVTSPSASATTPGTNNFTINATDDYGVTNISFVSSFYNATYDCANQTECLWSLNYSTTNCTNEWYYATTYDNASQFNQTDIRTLTQSSNLQIFFNGTSTGKYEYNTTSLTEAVSCGNMVCLNFPDYYSPGTKNCTENKTSYVWSAISNEYRPVGSNSTSFNLTNVVSPICLQENLTNSGICGGTTNGSYSVDYLISHAAFFDGDYSTPAACGAYTTCITNISYYSPVGIDLNNASLWRYKSEVNDANYSVNGSCLSQSPVKIGIIQTGVAPMHNYLYCYNGSGWTYMGDPYGSLIYEESMYWNRFVGGFSVALVQNNLSQSAPVKVTSAVMNLTAFPVLGSYPLDTQVFLGSNGNIDVSLPGYLEGTNVRQSRESTGSNDTNITLSVGSAGSSGSFNVPISKQGIISSAKFNITGWNITTSEVGNDTIDGTKTSSQTTCNTTAGEAKQNGTVDASWTYIWAENPITSWSGGLYGGYYYASPGDSAVDNDNVSAARIAAEAWSEKGAWGETYSSGEIKHGSALSGDYYFFNLTYNARTCWAYYGQHDMHIYAYNWATAAWDSIYSISRYQDVYCGPPGQLTECDYNTDDVTFTWVSSANYVSASQTKFIFNTTSKSSCVSCTRVGSGSASSEIMIKNITNLNASRNYVEYARHPGEASQFAQTNKQYIGADVRTYVSSSILSPRFNFTNVYLEVNESLPWGDNITYFFSPNNGASWYSIRPNQTINITGSTGMHGRLMATFNTTIPEYTSKLYNYTLVFNYTSLVSNPKVYIGSSTSPLWSYSGTFNATSEVVVPNADVQALSSTCSNPSCPVSFAVSSDLPGIVEINNINFTYTVNPISLNTTTIENLLLTNSTLTIPIYNSTNGTQVDGLMINYLGPKNLTIIANTSGADVNVTASIYYSNFSTIYPQYISRMGFVPKSRTQANITPTGQNDTQPIVTFDSVVDHPFYIYQSLASTPNSCYNFTISNSSSKSNGRISNTTKQYLTKANTTYNGTGWVWLDIVSCDPRILTNSYKWSVLCEGCVGAS
jgi:hypothetical protein